MRGFILALVSVGVLVSTQAKSAWADIIDTTNPGSLQAEGTVAVSASVPGGSQAAVPWCEAPGCYASGSTYSFNPGTLTFEGASASESVNVVYTGSGITASGTGSATGANPNASPYGAQPSSTFWISITPDVDVSYQLSGYLAGDVVSSGDENSGDVVFTDTTSPWYYIVAPTSTTGLFDVSGTMLAGDTYSFGIGVYPGADYAPPDTVNAEWGFTLDVGSAVTPTAVPEPGTLLLLGTGLAGLAARLRRRRQKQN